MLDGDAQAQPTISVVINNYNYARYLADALDSAVGQIGDRDEIVVVDDGSTDASRDILERYADIRQLRPILQENQGQLATVLNGLAAATGDLCVLLDSDDYLLDGYLERLRSLARGHPDIEFFFSDPEFGDQPPPGNARSHGVPEATKLPEGPTGTTQWGVWAAGEFVGTPTSGLALRKSLVEKFLAIRDALSDYAPFGDRAARLLGVRSDSHTFKRLSADGIIVRGSSIMGARKYHCTTPAFYYRIHGQNAFAGLGRMARTYIGIRRGRQIANMITKAADIPARPYVREVVEEARQRTRPAGLKRRIKQVLKYQYATLRARDAWWHRLAGLPRIAVALLPAPTAVRNEAQTPSNR